MVRNTLRERLRRAENRLSVAISYGNPIEIGVTTHYALKAKKAYEASQ